MVANTQLINIALEEKDLITPTSTQKFQLGMKIQVEDAEGAAAEYIYVKAHTGLTAYQPYVLGYSSTDDAEVVTAAPATLAAPGRIVVVPQVAFTSAYYGFVLVKGNGKVLKTAETYAVGDQLQILNTGTALVVDGTSGSTAYSINSCGICKEAGSTAVARDVYLYGISAVVAAS